VPAVAGVTAIDTIVAVVTTTVAVLDKPPARAVITARPGETAVTTFPATEATRGELESKVAEAVKSAVVRSE
jgi:hypothetical protein